jgi:hypothetical protein
MNEHERLEDPAFARLVAADPARRAPDPAQGVLRAKVDALITEQAEQRPAGGAEHGTARREPAGHEPAGHEQADELALRRHRRRTPWLVAAAVVGIVAAGGGGYVAGESGFGSGASPASDMAESADQAPSVMSERDEGGGESEATTDGLGPLAADGDLPAATGFVFHAGAGLSEVPRTAEVRVAGTHGESLGSYPVVSEAEAVERLGDPRFLGAVLGRPPQAPPQEETGQSTPPVPGGPVALPVEDVTIRSADLTEAHYTLPDGTMLLVPAYDLTDDAGRTWTVMAVDDELLEFGP